MTESRVVSPVPLLARKGLAVPAGLPTPDDALPRPRLGAEANRNASWGTPDPNTESAPGPIPRPEAASARGAEIAPAASLLPFDFLGAPGQVFDPGRPPAAEPNATLAPSAMPSAAPPPRSANLPAPEPATAPAAAPAAVKVDAPRVDPTWRIERDRRPAISRGGRVLPALAVALALAAVLGAAVLGAGWLAHRAGRLDLEALLTEIAILPTVMVAEVTPAETPAVAEDAVETAAAPTGRRGLDAPDQTPPSVDVVRVEPDGAAVFAGRAAPGAELILLDNGAPIGTVTADALGNWVFVPLSPLPAGAHQFGLVVKTVQGRVTLPAAETGGPDTKALAPKDVEDGPAATVNRGPASAP